jgi:hypothetical protein
MSIQSVAEWKARNAHRLIDCQWGCRITRYACKAYQLRNARHVIHFNGHAHPCTRVNADYVGCFSPEPCRHVISEEKARLHGPAQETSESFRDAGSRMRANRARTIDRLTNPDHMLREPRWTRSLIK